MGHVLDRCIWHALSGRHAAFAHGDGVALRYGTDHAPFAATRDDSATSLLALHGFIPANGAVALFTCAQLDFPETLVTLRRARAVQMVLSPSALAPGIPALPPSSRPLGHADVPAMTSLVTMTKPGPFAARTVELGRYLGIFEGDALVAMAGERMCLDGFVEISAVCTHPDHRGKGWGPALIAALARAAFEREETPFLHVFADNRIALGVYRKLGFAARADLHLAVVRRAGDAAV